MIKINCDMCGAKTKLFRTLIESTEMNVCRDCSKFGKVISELKEEKRPKKIEEITSTSVELLEKYYELEIPEE